MRRVKIAEIDIQGCQSRMATDGDTVTEYAELIEGGTKLPPVDLYYDGSTYWCADGIHRILAAKRLKHEDIEANVHKGTRDDALWHAAGANKTHGLHRTNEDKKRAVELALSLHPEMSDRAIAEHCGVNGKTVAARRPKPTAEIPQSGAKVATGEIPQSPKPVKRVGRDGIARTVPPRQDKPPKDETPPPKPPKNGKPTVPTPLRKKALKVHGALFRLLDDMKIGNKCKKPMHEVYEEIERA